MTFFSLYERITGFFLDARLFAGLSAEDRTGRML